MLGLPASVQACLFDLDGVVTDTAAVHSAAWKQMFDEFLKAQSAHTDKPFVPFTQTDYDTYVDGKPRADGTRSFLTSRGITLPEGAPNDPVDALTVQGLSNRKNELVLKKIDEGGVKVFDGSVRYIRAVKKAGLRTALVTSSANAQQVLAVANLTELFDTRVDGITAKEQSLAGKPAPDTFLAGARALGVEPAHAAVFEDALAGVRAGQAGHFAVVVGVDRVGQGEALKNNGANLVVRDLDELLEEA